MKQLLFAFLFLPLFCYSNDASLGSRGGNVFPLFRRYDIRMEREVIKIKMKRDSCYVSCRFWFKNGSRNTCELLVGFPDNMEDPSEVTRPLKRFTCKVAGKGTKVDHFKSITSVDADTSIRWYDSWFCWSVPFKELETVLIENSYTGEWSKSLGGTFFFDYLIGTAKTWKGSIGSGKVVFDFSDLASKLFIDTSYYSDIVLPKGMNRKIYNDSIVFSYNDYFPEWDESLRVSLWSFWEPPFGKVDSNNNPFRYMNLKRSKIDLRIMRNEIYARHGYVFKDNELRNYFEKQSWYRRDDEFSIEKLNTYEMLFANYLKNLELQNK